MGGKADAGVRVELRCGCVYGPSDNYFQAKCPKHLAVHVAREKAKRHIKRRRSRKK